MHRFHTDDQIEHVLVRHGYHRAGDQTAWLKLVQRQYYYLFDLPEGLVLKAVDGTNPVALAWIDGPNFEQALLEAEATLAARMEA